MQEYHIKGVQGLDPSSALSKARIMDKMTFVVYLDKLFQLDITQPAEKKAHSFKVNGQALDSESEELEAVKDSKETARKVKNEDPSSKLIKKVEEAVNKALKEKNTNRDGTIDIAIAFKQGGQDKEFVLKIKPKETGKVPEGTFLASSGCMPLPSFSQGSNSAVKVNSDVTTFDQLAVDLAKKFHISRMQFNEVPISVNTSSPFSHDPDLSQEAKGFRIKSQRVVDLIKQSFKEKSIGSVLYTSIIFAHQGINREVSKLMLVLTKTGEDSFVIGYKRIPKVKTATLELKAQPPSSKQAIAG